MLSSSVGPSTPEFHERLSSVPSRPSSPFASLCFSLYETRSASVKPSCAVTKLIDADGRRPVASYRSDEPVRRAANSPSPCSCAAPEVAHAVAVAAVPLRPQRREVADLVAAFADVPRLGDQLDLADDRILLDHVEERRQPVDVVQRARERRREVEPEPVDVHLEHPVAEAVHEQLQHVRVPHVQRVAGTRVVDVEALVLFREPVVRGVVDALEREHRAEVVAFGRVVVDDVEDHLDARVVHRLHHLLELLDLLAEVAARAVLAVRREVADRVVAPVVAQPHLHEPVVVDELVHRHQLDRGDAEPDEPVDDVGEREPRVGAAEVRRHRRVRLREPLGVDFVEQRLVQRCHRRAVVAPVEVRIDDDRLRHEARAVARARPALVAEAVRVDGLTPADLAGDGLAVRIEQQLLVVAAQALLRRPLAVDAEAVALARADAGQEHVMDERGLLAHRDARLVPGRRRRGTRRPVSRTR